MGNINTQVEEQQIQVPPREPIAIYYFHYKTGEYIGTGTAEPDPLDDKNWLVPGNATVEPLPELESDHVAVRIGGKHGKWESMLDKRGTEYWLADRSKHVIDKLGEDVPANGLLDDPGSTQEERALQRAREEHAWVKSELDKVEVQLMYHWTSDPRAKATVDQWSQYAQQLRNYTSTDDNGNPYIRDGETRPISPLDAPAQE
ncbi:hypothetical protein [Salinivibrio sp. KP-1]|uniref:hypothetical protein n=1 Tax=Salinivibrio sp. KP-1 TaxID=1406902 RepID=UPI000697783F|nr:hypothetical protein [Salinivibrio sp. KP-1]